MKRKILPLLISCVIVFTSLSECRDYSFLYNTYENPISAEVNEVKFKSEPEQVYPNREALSNPMQLYDWGFHFQITRELHSESAETISLSLNLISYDSLELNKRYPILTTEITEPRFFFRSNLCTMTNRCTAIWGWIEFTMIEDGHASGRFEADFAEDDTLLEVRNGQFGPLKVYFTDDRQNTDN